MNEDSEQESPKLKRANGRQREEQVSEDSLDMPSSRHSSAQEKRRRSPMNSRHKI